MSVSDKRRWWVIDVPAWGTRALYGTEAEAEEWRRHKAQWERSVARKRLAGLTALDLSHIRSELDVGQCETCKQFQPPHGRGHSVPCAALQSFATMDYMAMRQRGELPSPEPAQTDPTTRLATPESTP